MTAGIESGVRKVMIRSDMRQPAGVFATTSWYVALPTLPLLPTPMILEWTRTVPSAVTRTLVT